MRAAGQTAGARIRGARPATLLAASAILVSGTLLLLWLSRVTFWRDEWSFLLHRRGSGLDVFLDPEVEHLLALPILIYKTLLATFGMDSAAPFQLVAVALFLLSVAVLFVYLRRRVGEWVALAAILPILFLGQAWDDLLFPFQLAFFGSMASGLGALLALDRDDRAGDAMAAGLLTISILFSGLGVPFVAAATVAVGLTSERFRRAWVVVVPTSIFGLWYLGWGHESQTFFSFQNLATSPAYVLDGFASSISSVLGLGAPRDELLVSTLDWGRPLLVLAVGLGVWRLMRLGSVPRWVWVGLALGVGFWALVGLNSSPLAPPTAGRYQYIGAIFVLVIAAELARGVRIRGWPLAIVFAVAGAATLSNFSNLENAAGGLAQIAEKQRGGLAALELIRGEVDPAFLLTEENSNVDYLGAVDAAAYFSAADAFGSPAYTPDQLAGSSEAARVAADKVFAAGLGLGLAPAQGGVGGACDVAVPGAAGGEAGAALIPLQPGGAIVRARGGPVALRLRRYAVGSSPVDVGRIGAGEQALLEIPADGSEKPWQLELTGSGPVEVCEV